MDNRAIGIFDSGIGGLTAFKELHRLLPNERIIYFGDTGRVPYGSRSRDMIRKYTMQDIAFLKKHDVKLMIAACGTISSNLTREIIDFAGVPFAGVVNSSAQAACAASITGRIGVIGTTATMRSGAYAKAIHAIRAEAHVFGNACPLFVPLVENGFIQADNEITIKVAQQYLKPIIEADVDTLILGCTHFPVIYDIITNVLDYKATLIDPGRQVAQWAQSFLSSEGLLSGEESGKSEFYVSDSVDNFAATAELFLGEKILEDATQIDVESLQ